MKEKMMLILLHLYWILEFARSAYIHYSPIALSEALYGGE